MEKLKVFINGQWVESKTDKWTELHNPSTGELTGYSPCCTVDEVEAAVAAAKAAFPAWKKVPVIKRVQIMYKIRELILRDWDELTYTVAEENGKTWGEAEGDVAKAKEGTELATQATSLMMGESLMDASRGYETTRYREPLGVFVGVAPVNFPAMIPFGWMAPVCIVTGNTIVLKAASLTPRTAMKLAAIYKEAGVPDGVLNVVTCSRNEVDMLLKHPDVKGVTFVGSTPVGKSVYERAAATGKRVQALTQAKNHALVMHDCALERTVAGIVNSSFGCAGQRCMALPCVVVEESIADKFVAEMVKQAKEVVLSKAYDRDHPAGTKTLGPITYKKHYDEVLEKIQAGIDEGATLVLDGRNPDLPDDMKNGYYVGATIFDNVTEDMIVGREEIFAPVLCIKRCKNFEDGLRMMNKNPYANGSVIYTQSGYYAHEFAENTDGGMVGVNVGIPVPIGFFPFSGHKQSFFGDLHCLGKDAYRFFTESKCVTRHFFDEEEAKSTNVSTWDGTI